MADGQISPRKPVRLADYAAPVFRVDTVALDFDLDPSATFVRATLKLRRQAPGKLDPAHISMLKRNNVAIALDCARLSRDLLGANGIMDEYPIMRHLCNLETVKTYEGTEHIHTLVIGERVTGIPAYK